MRISLPNLQELSTDWTVARDQLQQDLQRLQTAITTGWSQEHHPDGSHGDVVADSLDLQGAAVGEWVDLPYSAARFDTDGSGVWTVDASDVNYLRMSRVGQIVFVMFSLVTTALTVNPVTTLYMRVPELHALPVTGAVAVTSQIYIGGVFQWHDVSAANAGIGTANALATGGVGSSAPSTTIGLDRISPTNATYQNWPLSANFNVYGSLFFACQPNNTPLAYSF